MGCISNVVKKKEEARARAFSNHSGTRPRDIHIDNLNEKPTNTVDPVPHHVKIYFRSGWQGRLKYKGKQAKEKRKEKKKTKIATDGDVEREQSFKKNGQN